MTQRISALAVPALVGVLALAAAATAIYGVAVLAFGWEATVGEALNAWFAHGLLHGDGLYRDPSDGTALYPIYAPGFYLASAPFQLGDVELWPGRLVSLAGFAGAAVAASAVAMRLGADRWEAAASALGTFASGFVLLIASAGRPDGLAIGLVALMLLASTRWEDTRARRDLALIAAAAVVLLLTRQSYLPLLLAPLLAIGVRDRRAAVELAVGVALATLAAAGVAELASGGSFSDDLGSFASGGTSLAALRGVLEAELTPFPNPILIVGAVCATVALLSSPRSVRTAHLLWFASLLTLPAAAKLGSAANYWLPTVYASSVLLGPALAQARALPAAGLAWRSALAAGLALALAVPCANLLSDAVRAHDTFSRLEPVNSEAAQRLEALGGPLLADRADLVIASGADPDYDAFQVSQEERNGAPGAAAIAARVRAGEYAAIQSSVDLEAEPLFAYQGVPAWSPAIARAVNERYCLEWSSVTPSPTSFGIWVYVPCQDSS